MIASASCALPLAFLDMLGGSELLVIFLLVLIFFGGEKMPEFARGLGKAIREFRKAAAGVEEEFKKALEEAPAKRQPTYPPAVPPTPSILPPRAAPPTPTSPNLTEGAAQPSGGEPSGLVEPRDAIDQPPPAAQPSMPPAPPPESSSVPPAPAAPTPAAPKPDHSAGEIDAG